MSYINKLTMVAFIAAVQFSSGTVHASADTKIHTNIDPDNSISYLTENDTYSSFPGSSHENNLQSGNRQKPQYDRAKDRNRRDEYEKRMRNENERHEREMRRRPHETQHEWRERQKREDKRHKRELEQLRSIFTRVISDILVNRHK
ncbi:hypothetical protein [Pectinatus haikarae]|uniref:Secreted protein n=1 Tax=Pectinatus haikarae TaxID=349096 RepID=A0ABT9Y9F6_9FIRM|nr:hypothetical protein [Pectinatus haikarae]MDQ0204469.1 hypothetical protein [Pectinatus haikarae]